VVPGIVPRLWQDDSMPKVEIEITGMTCDHCVNAVTGELNALGANTVGIDLNADGVSVARLDSDVPISDEQIADAVNNAGYDVVGVNRY